MPCPTPLPSLANDSLPLALYSAQQVRELDARLIASGISGLELMSRAAQAAWQALRERWPEVRVLDVLTGSGNNAGDGYLLAALAQQNGFAVRVLAVADVAKLRGDAASAYARAQQVGVVVQPWTADTKLRGLVVDALLGTGQQGAPRGAFAQAIEQMNASGLPVLALDIPSGLDADSGHVAGAVVRADLTVTFIGLKLGLFCGIGMEQTGRLRFADLDADSLIVQQQKASAQRLTTANMPKLSARPRTAHKGLFGHLWLLGGDHGMGGAALLAAEAALRGGAGRVSLATRLVHVTPALSRLPELMVQAADSSYALTSLLQQADVLVAGPGLGQAPWGRSLLSAAAAVDRPQVWDADALNLLAEGAVNPPKNLLITPHPGEAARLLGWQTAKVQQNRPKAALELAQRYRATVILKGAGTLIAQADGQMRLCDRGHPAMSGPGFGDVLAGLCAALLAQGLPPFDAACLAVWLHAAAGQQLGEEGGRGLLASDLIPVIRRLLQEHSPCLNPPC